jgi:probable rRNA maturation factor
VSSSDSETVQEHNPESPVLNDAGSDYLITVQIEPQYEDRLDGDKLHQLAMTVLREEGAPTPCEVGIVITDDEEVHALNRQYLGHDYQTDVISFGMSEGGDAEFVTPAERPQYLGDVVISYDRAAEQASDYGHSTEVEVATLMVHGLLHLLGYDDTTEPDRAKMHARQDELVGISNFGFRISK